MVAIILDSCSYLFTFPCCVLFVLFVLILRLVPNVAHVSPILKCSICQITWLMLCRHGKYLIRTNLEWRFSYWPMGGGVMSGVYWCARLLFNTKWANLQLYYGEWSVLECDHPWLTNNRSSLIWLHPKFHSYPSCKSQPFNTWHLNMKFPNYIIYKTRGSGEPVSLTWHK
jgi:hypothetical protein